MDGSSQDKLGRVRPPRVQITYDVETNGAIRQKELPFVVGVIADLGGMTAPREKLKERDFVGIDPDNFDQVLEGIQPTLAYRVENRIAGDGTQLGVNLHFNRMEDFEPARVVEQVEPLRKALELRRRLAELLARMDSNDSLVDRLNDIIRDTEKLSAVARAALPAPEEDT